VWAVGDCPEVPKPNGTGTYGATAQNASREGKLAAQNILRVLRGEDQKPFTYMPICQLALVGKHKGVASIYGMKFSGFTAYLLRRGVYIMKMPFLSSACACWATGAWIWFLVLPRNIVSSLHLLQILGSKPSASNIIHGTPY
jgi:NADH:ubiquinone reductase (H+-translocating)